MCAIQYAGVSGLLSVGIGRGLAISILAVGLERPRVAGQDTTAVLASMVHFGDGEQKVNV